MKTEAVTESLHRRFSFTIHLSRSSIALLLSLFILPYFVNLSGPSLWDATEAFYAETPREMIELGSYLIPYFNYEPRLNKPPLSYWLVLPFYWAFGPSYIYERLVNAVGASLIVLLTFALGRRMFDLRVGLFAAAIVATTPRLLVIAQKSVIDTYITLFVTAALFFFWQAFGDRARETNDRNGRTGDEQEQSSRSALSLQAPKSRSLSLVLFYLALSLGTLMKGPLAVVLIGGAILLFTLLTKRWQVIRRMNLPLGALILAAVVLPWYIALYGKLGWEPIRAFILSENIVRFASDIDHSSRGPLYYLTVLPADFFPWALFLIPAGISSYRIWREKPSYRPPIAFLVSWIAFIFLFFSAARNKHEYYLLPLYPAAAVLIGWLFSHGKIESVTVRKERSSQIITGLVGTLMIVGGVLLGLIIKNLFDARLALFPLGLLIGGSVRLLWQAFRSPMKQTPRILIGLALGYVFYYQIVCLPLIERYRPTKPLCQLIERTARSDDLVGTYNVAAPSMIYYLRRQIFEIYESQTIVDLFQSDRRVFCLVRERDLPPLQEALKERLTVIDRQPLLTLRLSVLLDQQTRSRIPHLLLVTNY